MINTVLKSLVVSAITLLIASSGAVADEASSPWVIKADISDDLDDFIANSPIVREMRTNNEPNEMVYAVDVDQAPMLPVYELLGCMHLTNPDSKMEVDSGGGFDITIEDVTFPGGVWTVYLRIRQIERIELLDKITMNVLDKISIDDLIFTDIEQIVRTARLLSSACLADPSEQ